MVIFHFSTVYKALDQYINGFNERVRQSRQRLKASAVATAKEIIRIYGASLLKAKGNQNVSNARDLPPLSTNNHQLATLVKCSPRSIQRHICKLRQAGIITRMVHHGSNANYELWLNADIVLIKRDPVVNTGTLLLIKPKPVSGATPEKQAFSEPQKTDCPPSYTGNIINNILNEVNTVDFLVGDFPGNATGNMTGNTGEVVIDKTNSEKNSSAAPALPANQGESNPAHEELIALNVQLFWLTAKNLLYKHKSITARQERTAKELIRGLYTKNNSQDPDALHSMYIQRIRLAAEYVQRDPVKRYIPLPYIYFNPDNVKGFRGTEEWYWKTMTYKSGVNQELLLERLIHRYRNNEIVPLSQRMPPLKLYKVCEKILAAHNDESLINRFYVAVLAHLGLEVTVKK